MINKKYIKCACWLVILLVILIVVAILSLYLGSVKIPAGKILSLLINNESGIEQSIILNIRLPRILLGLAIGGALSLAGVLLQGMFRNPLVEPYTLGISGGAALGVSFNIVFGLNRAVGAVTLPAAGFLGAMCVVFLVYTLSMRKGVLRMNGVLLTGVMISFISSALIMLIMAVARAEDLHGIVFWIMGSLEESSWLLIKAALLISLTGLAVSYWFCLDLNALSLGEEDAKFLGVKTERTKKFLFVIASLLTGLSVSVSGIIGFIGLVVPHFVRMFIGSDHRILLISSYIAGAAFLIMCDTLARTIIAPIELPVGVMTGIIGGILFVYALTKRQINIGKY
jgi:iron complex transport system permease protein